MSVPQTLLAERYRLVRMIATGGMGVVWEAWDERLQRPVAIKELRTQPGVTEDEAEQAKNRAMREARITARLHHPHAVPVFDAVEHDGRPCLIMQYLPSTPLSAILRQRGRLEPHEVARIGAEIASALAAAHKLKIVHRDVKPGNILITDEGTAHISDFGISHALGDATLTRTGMVYGTPAYLAPEVARGGDSTFASDVFSLGSTLYAALEGDPPFGSDPNSIALLHRVASGKMTPPQHAGVLTPFLLDMLSPEPKQRPSMKSIASLLNGLQKEPGSGKPTLPLPPLADRSPAAPDIAPQTPLSDDGTEPERGGGGVPWPFGRKEPTAGPAAAGAGRAVAGAGGAVAGAGGAVAGAAAAGALGGAAAGALGGGAGAAAANVGAAEAHTPAEPTVAADVEPDATGSEEPIGEPGAAEAAEADTQFDAEIEAGAAADAESDAESEPEPEPEREPEPDPEPETEPELEPEPEREHATPQDADPGDETDEASEVPGIAAAAVGGASVAGAGAPPALIPPPTPGARSGGNAASRGVPATASTIPAPTRPAPTVAAPTVAADAQTAATTTIGAGAPPRDSRRRRGIVVLLLAAAAVLAAFLVVPGVLNGLLGDGSQGNPNPAAAPESNEPNGQSSGESSAPNDGGSAAPADPDQTEPPPEDTESPEETEPEPPAEAPEDEPDPEDRDQATTPEGAVIGYYALLPGDTDEAWERLTANYQQGEPIDRDYFEEFWDGFDEVTVSDVTRISDTEVEATVTYTHDDGRQESERRYYRFVEEDGILKIDASST